MNSGKARVLKLIVVPVISILMVTLSSAQSKPPSNSVGIRKLGFHGVFLGQPISRLPFPCDDPKGSCEGLVSGIEVIVSNWNGRVSRLSIGYVKFRIADKQFNPSPITLAQAIKVHSLQAGAKLPVLRDAGEVAGSHWLLDSGNHLVYWIDQKASLAPETIGKSLVPEVDYLSSDAPIFEPAQSKSLGSVEASLLAEARRSAMYMPSAPTTIPQLSTYMRDTGLLYIETAEKAVNIMTDLDIPLERQSDFSEEQFKLLDALEDRIEIHVQTQSDKDFFEYGLKKFRTLAHTDAVTTGPCMFSQRKRRKLAILPTARRLTKRMTRQMRQSDFISVATVVCEMQSKKENMNWMD